MSETKNGKAIIEIRDLRKVYRRDKQEVTVLDGISLDVPEVALKLVGLQDRMDHTPRQLSGGQQQRVAIARAVVADPNIIVADEPTGDLDRKSAGEVLQLLKTLNETLGKTIVMVTHDPHAAESAKIQRRLDKGLLT